MQPTNESSTFSDWNVFTNEVNQSRETLDAHRNRMQRLDNQFNSDKWAPIKLGAAGLLTAPATLGVWLLSHVTKNSDYENGYGQILAKVVTPTYSRQYQTLERQVRTAQARLNRLNTIRNQLADVSQQIEFIELRNYGVIKIAISATVDQIQTLTNALQTLETLQIVNQPARTLMNIGDIRTFGNLNRLNLIRCDLSDPMMQAIAALPLRTLTVINCPTISDVGIAHLSNAQELTFLQVANCARVTGPGFSGLTRSRRPLRLLIQSSHRIRALTFNGGALARVECQRLPNLVSLQIDGVEINTPPIIQNCDNLRSLNFHNCRRLNLSLGRARVLYPNSRIEGLQNAPNTRTQQLRRTLEQSVVGQPYAIDRALETVLLARERNQSPTPISILLFVGPSGVGKTELAQAIAGATGRRDAFKRLDMGSYRDGYSFSRMIGSDPGLVNNEDGGQLTGWVQNHEDAVILFDEIEKADAGVHRGLLSIIDQGNTDDANGRNTDFSQTIVIMTSNAGANEIAQLDWTQNDSHQRAINIARTVLSNSILPEFVSRLQFVVPFRPITPQVALQILRNQANQIVRNEHRVQLTITDPVLNHYANQIDRRFGVRPLIQGMRGRVLGLLNTHYASEDIRDNDQVMIEYDHHQQRLRLRVEQNR